MKLRVILWTGALVLGIFLGCIAPEWLNGLFTFLATIYTRLFQFVAVPTITLAIITTLSSIGQQKSAGRLFGHTIMYTLLTTIAAASVALVMYLLIRPDNLPAEALAAGVSEVPGSLGEHTYYDYILSVVPNNVVRPFLEGNVLSVLLIAAAIGLALCFMPDSGHKETLNKFFNGLQELCFLLIKALIWALPLGILAFAAQLAAQVEGGLIVGSLGKYVAVVICGNVLQFLVVLPLFLLLRGLNPVKVMSAMSPALVVAFFTKSSAATLPVTMSSAENNLKVRRQTARFVLPVCTTINMNGCSAFILVTSLFVMQNAGMTLSPGTMVVWLFIAVLSAIGNAGVPMGCYFLTLSLMSGIGAPIGLMGVILPIYTVIDMVETTENVWSDACVCAMVDNDLRKRDDAESINNQEI